MRSKYTIEQVIAAYESHGSVWGAAKVLGLCGQSVHERLVRAGYDIKSDALKPYEITMIKNWYAENKGDLQLKKLAELMGRPHTNICRAARKLGLTDLRRPAGPKELEKVVGVPRWDVKAHPRGMKGKKHSDKVKAKLSLSSTEYFASTKGTQAEADRILKMLKTKDRNGTMIPPKHGNWKAAWYVIGDRRIYMRSSWEYKYALLLEEKKRAFVIKDWEFEPQTFWFEKVLRGVRSYLPDFRITWHDGSVEYHEVKGWLDPKSKTKLKRMRIYYPQVRIELLMKKEYERCIALCIIPNEKEKAPAPGESEGCGVDWLAGGAS